MNRQIKKLSKKLIPKSLVDYYFENRQIRSWKGRGYTENSPQFIKQRIFLKYGIPNAEWVESGTYLGTTTKFLSLHFPKVHSIEPDKELFELNVKKFKDSNVELYNGISEDVLPILIQNIKDSCNFWLDGHYSGGITFKGPKDCPVVEELGIIKKELSRLVEVVILIDDVRCFLPGSQVMEEYPPLDFLVDWARNNNLSWRIEHDIFIMKKF